MRSSLVYEFCFYIVSINRFAQLPVVRVPELVSRGIVACTLFPERASRGIVACTLFPERASRGIVACTLLISITGQLGRVLEY